MTSLRSYMELAKLVVHVAPNGSFLVLRRKCFLHSRRKLSANPLT